MIQKKGKREVTFIYTPRNGTCRSVALAGTFNQWQPEQGRMTRQKDGTYRKRLQLEPGQYRYKFVVDGEWVEDPEADGLVPNPFGTSDSIVTVGQA